MIGLELNDDDVVSITGEDCVTQSSTATVSEIRASIGRDLLPKYLSWLVGGVNCRVLRVGKGWQRGKIRLRIEYFPYESEKLKDTPKPSADVPLDS